jgi:hypothetical protein
MTERRRMGRFTISCRLVGHAPKAALAILEGCIVTRAESLWHADRIEYTGISEHFDLIQIGDEVPMYEATVKDLVGGKYDVTWKRTT